MSPDIDIILRQYCTDKFTKTVGNSVTYSDELISKSSYWETSQVP
jgi:hypothetical protein